MTWWEERNARFARERAELHARWRAQGFRLLRWLAYFDPRTGEHPLTTSIGETEHVVVTNVPTETLRIVPNHILVGPDSEVRRSGSYADACAVARELAGVVVVVFKGVQPT